MLLKNINLKLKKNIPNTPLADMEKSFGLVTKKVLTQQNQSNNKKLKGGTFRLFFNFNKMYFFTNNTF